MELCESAVGSGSDVIVTTYAEQGAEQDNSHRTIHYTPLSSQKTAMCIMMYKYYVLRITHNTIALSLLE